MCFAEILLLKPSTMNAYSKLTLIVGLIAGSTSAKLCKNKTKKWQCNKDDLCEWTKGALKGKKCGFKGMSLINLGYQAVLIVHLRTSSVTD